MVVKRTFAEGGGGLLLCPYGTLLAQLQALLAELRFRTCYREQEIRLYIPDSAIRNKVHGHATVHCFTVSFADVLQ